ncbi:MAG: ATP-binding cassette domain-containing protein [Sedimentisphaerales bacterium]|jgi:ABC-type ATPase with predicted acetyltransferase domain|nr:ATP-binding cassette domain-containing protein [Sedimentisphaerales bacterium]HNY77603.1 ATP-binding cassette domain-containing protein [Sedimentisphaerales bacterium]HOC61936.1 ATP-binding cassette domain-containing protein [Sedimentisphaerales bacterium]HOH63778.1 ATP-binding cassette domain-containing protein [Sedimentisphaerales bacterium]HPY48318.1 ATP-binding cassette domain-containing protein [Sedimentisphaerales bacterium]
MSIYTVKKEFDWAGPVSERVVKLCRMFGVTLERLADRGPVHQCSLQIEPGDIVCITGPSGSGKSVLLRELEQSIPAGDRINLDDIRLPDDQTVIDCFDSDLVTSLQTLTAAGLGGVFGLVNRPCLLSDGQKYRFRLARALAMARPFVFADEFCSELDRITAATVAFNAARFVRRARTTLIVATSHDDILMDLSPDALVVKDFTSPARVIYKTARRL